MRPSVYIRMIVLLVLVLVGWCGDAAWGIRLEHSLDGVTFSVIGDVDVDEVQSGSFQIEDYTSKLQSLKPQHSGDDGLYFVRAGSQLVGSFPATCWMSGVENHRAVMKLHLLDTTSSSIQSLSLHAPCSESATKKHSQSEKGGAPAVVVVTPLSAPQIPTSGDGSPQSKISLESTFHASPDFSSEAIGGSTVQQGAQKGKAPVKDERTWLQKNWIFVAVGFFLVANRLGGANNQEGGRPVRQVPVASTGR